MRRLTLKHLLLALFLVLVPQLCLAQGSAGPFAREPATEAAGTHTTADDTTAPGFVSLAIATIINEQRKFHRRLADALTKIRKDGATAAAWTLILTSFLYGVFHAAGPGHGKAILTTYLATHRQRMPRGIMLAAAAAAVQGIVAILLVFGLTALAGWAARDTQSAVRWAEQLSFALVAALGAFLLYRAAQALSHALTRSARDHGHAGHTLRDHHHDDHCGHAHMPTPNQMDSARDLRTMLGIVLSIGIRPCSGAVLVLAVANVFGIPWAGIAAVFSMSVGTAIAVATLALVVLTARHVVTRFIATDGPGITIAGNVVALVGGAVICTLGVMLLIGSFGPAHPLGL